MFYPKRQLILTCIATMLAGCVLHFLYHWWPNPVTALVSPVNESLWEHVKLVFWPYLAAALILNRDRPGGVRPWLLTLPLLCGITLLLGWLYHVTLGGEALWVDLALYAAVMVLGFWLPTRFSGPFRGARWAFPIVLTAVLGCLILLFTLWPPELPLFADLSLAGAWYQLPC